MLIPLNCVTLLERNIICSCCCILKTPAFCPLGLHGDAVYVPLHRKRKIRLTEKYNQANNLVIVLKQLVTTGIKEQLLKHSTMIIKCIKNHKPNNSGTGTRPRGKTNQELRHLPGSFWSIRPGFDWARNHLCHA